MIEYELSNEEKNILNKMLGDDYILINHIQGKCYSLTEKGIYDYNSCFTPTTNSFFSNQKYELVTPIIVVQFYSYYIIKVKEYSELWFRGTQNSNGNYELDCCGDSLEEIIGSL